MGGCLQFWVCGSCILFRVCSTVVVTIKTRDKPKSSLSLLNGLFLGEENLGHQFCNCAKWYNSSNYTFNNQNRFVGHWHQIGLLLPYSTISISWEKVSKMDTTALQSIFKSKWLNILYKVGIYPLRLNPNGDGLTFNHWIWFAAPFWFLVAFLPNLIVFEYYNCKYRKLLKKWAIITCFPVFDFESVEDYFLQVGLLKTDYTAFMVFFAINGVVYYKQLLNCKTGLKWIEKYFSVRENKASNSSVHTWANAKIIKNFIICIDNAYF